MFPRLPQESRMDKPMMEAAGIEPAQDSPGLLYAIQGAHGGPIKIGWTNSSKTLSERLRSLQVGNPHPLKVVWEQPGSRQDEQRLHRKYRERRLSGEWFSAVGEITTFFGVPQELKPLEELYDQAFQAGWQRGFDDANATDEENENPRRAARIEEYDDAERDWILTGNPWALRRMGFKPKKAA